jgi:paraquat-inducible protein A
MAARCSRCGTTLRRARADPLGRGLALTLAAIALLTVMCTTTLMTVSTAGIVHGANLLSGPTELVRRGMTALAIVVVFTTLIAPFVKLLGTAYVLAGLRLRDPPRHVRRVFVLVERLSPWSMIEVFVFGVFVAYVKLGDLVHISLGIGVFALLCLTFVMVWADSVLDRHAVWGALERETPPEHPMHRVEPSRRFLAGAVGCETCGLVSAPGPGAEHDHASHCPRCDSVLHARKPDSIARTWALVIAAAVLYVPANYYPVLTVMQLGAGAPSTIIGGVEELISSGMYPLAALVFFASIAVPMLKLVGLSVMLIATQARRSGRLRDRTRLSFIVRGIGRWSMIDIFMESLLGALVRFGTIVTIEPGVGAVAFCAVVILTMFAAEMFDPRLMWDAAEEAAPGPAAAPAQAF